ncbi:Ankyrin repeat protein [Plasmopara halstedii]|uniref:Ankyrin repeat protein n=1 Tax=Plasmopara halstedii TaxID=4781 RepID=A0A0P1AYJ2_PLAHL|nr:Ankyrin repeat protein [Plasmopara halstedii]CEG47157.1 Ankyrin repeat protein [Plasmopara halstedii]|eukprot:XP_024583526.1 Ankyrin repeat protein [Plasmopara halstedii]
MSLLMRPPPLHVAVWEGDIELVRNLLDDVCPVSEQSVDSSKAEALKNLLELKDVRGNSALHLAVRIVQPHQQAIVKLLLERDASVASRNIDGWSCAHDAALCDDEFMLAQVYLQGEKQVIKALEATQETSMQALEKLPDFEAEIFIEAHSWVPIVSSVLPSDTIKIWKRGSQLRIDSTLKGLDGIKWKKGQLSQIYLGRHGGDRAGHVIVMDHHNKVFYDVFQAMHNSSVGNMDMALHVMLTTAMSSSKMDVAHLEFVKQKEVKAGENIDESKKKSRSKLRNCPWPGTTYKMQNVSMEAQFRPAVSLNRKMKRFSSEKDTPFDEVQQLVQHLYSSVPYAKENKGSKSQQKDCSSCSSDGSASDDIAGNTIQLKKGRKVEMHLDVIAGDSIRWEFTGKSSDFCFSATYFHEDQLETICRSDGVKNATIVGAFEVEHTGSFVLRWKNTQKGFKFDRSGIEITYDVVHTRPADLDPSVNAVSTSTSTSLEVKEDKDESNSRSHSATKLSDEQKCDFFRQHNHSPNPSTVTTSFVEYFMLDAQEPEDSRQDGAKNKRTLMSKLFEDKTQQQQTAIDSLPKTSEVVKAFGMKNTFRSLTLVPAARRVRKKFEAKVVMSESFPIQPRDFFPVIELLSTTGEHMKNLEEFFRVKLPPGFPVKFELPMMFTIRVAYTFNKITLSSNIDPEIFKIPSNYQEVFTLDEMMSGSTSILSQAVYYVGRQAKPVTTMETCLYICLIAPFASHEAAHILSPRLLLSQ